MQVPVSIPTATSTSPIPTEPPGPIVVAEAVSVPFKSPAVEVPTAKVPSVLTVRVFSLNYLQASDVAPMLSPFLSQQGTLSVTPAHQARERERTGGRGSAPRIAEADATPGEDSVVVRDYPENLAHLDEIISKLDVRPQQVLIEAVILSVPIESGKPLGMNIGLLDKLKPLTTSDTTRADDPRSFQPSRVLATSSNSTVTGFGDEGLKFGFVDRNVSGFIRALEASKKVEVLASPRVLVLNKQRAEIQLGKRIGYRAAGVAGQDQGVRFLNVGTSLSLRPSVSRDGMIRLEIHPEKSSGALDADGIPQMNTSELTSDLLVPDGATIVIGGLIDSTERPSGTSLIGPNRMTINDVFSRERPVKTGKSELIVLLTPRILDRDRATSGAGETRPEPTPPSGAAVVSTHSASDAPPPFAPAAIASKSRAALARQASNTPNRVDYRWIGGEAKSAEITKATEVDAPVQAASMTIARTSDAESQPQLEVYSATYLQGVQNPKAPSPTLETGPISNLPETNRELVLPIAVYPGSKSEESRDAAPASSVRKAYRPGDLTRGVIDRIKSRASKTPAEPATIPEIVPTSATRSAVVSVPNASVTASPSSPPVSDRQEADAMPERLASYAPNAVSASEPKHAEAPKQDQSGSRDVIYRWHTVLKGEDFGTLARAYYGSASLRGALWKVNRHLVPSPEQLSTGAMILIPPTEVLDKIVLESAVSAADTQDNLKPAEAPRKRTRLFSGR